MNIINNNPYRLLGVFANSPIKERVANEGKLKAFLKVGKQVSFPLDLTQYIPPITRTVDTPTEAEAKLTLPVEQIKYAQFWFIKSTPLDNVAFNHLFAGDMDKAIEIWNKRDDASSLQNRIVCYLIRNDYRLACALAEPLYHVYSKEFVEYIVGAGSNVPKNLDFNFLDVLCNEVGSKTILNSVSDSNWKKHISAKSITPIIIRLQSAIDTAKASRGKGPNARYEAGIKLMNSTKGDLALLKTFISTNDLQYKMIADKLGVEILQCGIDYFNDSDDQDAAPKAMILQQYALSIVVGQMAKDRCQENVKILKRIIASLPPKEVFVEDRAIRNELESFSKKPSRISNAITLLRNTKSHLVSIRQKLGVNNSYYLKLSTLVVSNALGDIIEEVNAVQNDHDISIRLQLGLALTDYQINQIKSTLQAAWNATKMMDYFDMESDFKSYRYSQNRSTLQGLCNSFGISTDPKSSDTDDDTPWGCIIAVIIALIIVCFALCSRSNDSNDNSSETSTSNIVSDSVDTTALMSNVDSIATDSTGSYTPTTDEEYESDYKFNRLETGAKPYKAYYGKGKTGQDYLQFKTSGDNDYVVMAKRHGSNKVINHIYIRGGDTETMHLPDGNYDIYFYSGKGWDPEKDMGSVKGGFVDEAPIEKDENVSLYDQYGEYTLYPVQGGDLVLAPSDKQDMFK